MPTKLPKPHSVGGAPAKDRRAAPGANGTSNPVRRLHGVLNRPLGLQRRDGHLQLVLVERRRVPRPDRTSAPAELRDELSACLLACGADYAAHAMRQLVHVHDALGRKGWPGVGALPASVLGEALAQAEKLASEVPSPALAAIIERLRPLQTAAEIRDERQSRVHDFKLGKNLEVSESTHAEFEELERSWGGTSPAGLDPPKRQP